jgi:hypothetical protein
MASLDDLRRELSRLEQRATAKISRNRRKGIELAGTQFDPRIGPDQKGKRYTRAKLERAVNELRAFNSRGTQFVPLSGGEIAPSSMAQEFVSNQRKYNNIVNREFNRVKGFRLPNAGDDLSKPTGMSIEERDASLFEGQDKRAKRAAGEATRRLYEPMNVKLSNVQGVQGLEALNKMMRKRLSRDYKPAEIARQRGEFEAMMKRTGGEKAIEMGRRLTDHQFDILWNYGNFATDTSRDYQRITKLATGGASAEYDRVHEDAMEDIMDSLQWAMFLPASPRSTRSKK